MKSPLFVLLLVAALLPTVAFSQHEFHASKSGVWCDNRNWVTSENGVWLVPQDGVFPGERHNRNADVTIDDGSVITVGEGDVIHVNSITIIKGRLDVNGTLIIGPTKDDAPEEKPVQDNSNAYVDDHRVYAKLIPHEQVPQLQLQQNMPNPVFSSVTASTNFSFYLDKEYSLVTLTVYDQMGRAVKTLYSEYSPASGWKKVTMNTEGLSSGSYPVILQVGDEILRVSMAVIK